MFKKILILGLTLITCIGLFAGCSDAELKKGIYATDDGSASITLSEGNRYNFIRGIMYSYVPEGNYSIQKNKLILHVSESEEYIFNIKNGQLVYESGDGSVVKGTVFKLSVPTI